MTKVLVICYYWPPAGGPGVQRWLKFVKYLPDFGVTPILYIPKNAHYPIKDTSMVSEVPKGLEILRQPIREPYALARFLSKKKTQEMSSGILEAKEPSFLGNLMRYIRGNLFIPDARVGWVKPSIKFLKQYLSDNPDIQTVITTGPPHSLHLIGLGLKKERSVQWIADFRDPWTTIHYHKSLPLTQRAKRKHKELERQVLQSADSIVVTSPTTKKEFQAITNQPITVITNGYDTVSVKSTPLDVKFSLVHIGSLLQNRNPEILWQVLAEMLQEIPSFKKDLQIKLIGLVAKELMDSLEKYGLRPFVELPGYVPHDQVVSLQQSAQVLLLIEMDREETKAILPGKLFEYLRAQRPILAFGPRGSDIAPILQETAAGSFYSYSEKESLKKQLIDFYDQFQLGNLRNESTGWKKYHRKELTDVFAKLIKSI